METLLKPLIDNRLQDQVSIQFFETPDGDRKVSLLTKVPRKAVSILVNRPKAIVVAMPDLYPKNKGFPHQTFDQLQEGILKQFEVGLKQRGIQDQRLKNRFQVVCFKHDLEAMLLAAKEALEARLGIKQLEVS